MPPSTDLPAWLRQGGSARGAPGGGRNPGGRSARLAALAILLLAAGGGAGYLLGSRRTPPAEPPPPAPVCPPPVACADPPGHIAAAAPALVHAAHHKPAHPTPAALVPLPDRKPLEEGERTKALRAFATQRAPELRDCLDDPDRGPPRELGAAFEIAANGVVDLVQILGADGAPRDVRRCYANHLKKWRFPEELLRGEEKLLINFVL
ncbi:MAG TPA: hypothetical protein VHG72_10525 [Polyangia bacterium]|nr:hypothetical protein [Polyangia bacterium]